jgi:hypothetical protein
MRLKNSLAAQSGSSNNFIGRDSRCSSASRRRSTFRHLIILRLVYSYFLFPRARSLFLQAYAPLEEKGDTSLAVYS